MQKNRLLIILICLTLAAAVFFLLSKNSPAEPTYNLAETPESGDPGKTLGTLKLNMTIAEVETLLGEPLKVTSDETIRWYYEALTVAFHSFNKQVSEIRALTGCSFTLDSGIGIGSTESETRDVYPLAYETNGDLDIDKVNTWLYVDDPEHGLQIGITNGIVSTIIWKDYGNPLLEALTVNEITLYTPDKASVLAIDKAAKRICTILTISEPEEAPLPDGSPIGWMDFGNGTAVCLYDGDYAVVFRYEGLFDPEMTQKQKVHLDGVFFGLGDAFAKALQNPVETW